MAKPGTPLCRQFFCLLDRLVTSHINSPSLIFSTSATALENTYSILSILAIGSPVTGLLLFGVCLLQEHEESLIIREAQDVGALPESQGLRVIGASDVRRHHLSQILLLCCSSAFFLSVPKDAARSRSSCSKASVPICSANNDCVEADLAVHVCVQFGQLQSLSTKRRLARWFKERFQPHASRTPHPPMHTHTHTGPNSRIKLTTL